VLRKRPKLWVDPCHCYVGGYFGPLFVGWLKLRTGRLELPFDALGLGILIAAGLTFLLPKTAPVRPASSD